MRCSAQWAVGCCKDLVCCTDINVQGTSSISWSRSEVAQRQTRYSCLKELFSGKAGHWEHTAASAAAFSVWLSFINCFTLISRRTGPSFIRNVATTTKRIAEYLLWIENHLWKDELQSQWSLVWSTNYFSLNMDFCRLPYQKKQSFS